MTETADDLLQTGPDEASDSALNELAAQLGLSTDEAASAWNAVLAGLEQQEAATGADGPEFAAGERFSLGDLVDLFDGGEKPDLGEMAKDELVKAVAKKLGITAAQAGAVVDMILQTMGKSSAKPKKKPRKTSSSATTKPKPKPKPKKTTNSTASKPKPKPKKTATSSSTAKPKPKPKKTASSTASKPKPKPRKRTTTRGGESTEA